MDTLGTLREGETLHGFRLDAVYTDDADAVVGARLRHGHTGLLLDLLGSETVPQAYLWVDTVPDSDRGEPHTQEHLLLGKGDKGRATALMEDMALVDSSAFTDQLSTVYHLGTPAGIDTFFEVLEARIDALLRPDYTDEEIRREVHHLGVATNPDGSLSLEEKGTIYAEMVSAMQQPWSRAWHHAMRSLYGEGHPLGWMAGGLPEAIRELRPEHIRAFHARCYQLRGMGMIAVLPPELEPERALERLDAMLRRLQPEPSPAVERAELPPPRPGPPSIQEVPFPERDPSASASLLISWPPDRDPPLRERILMELLLGGLGGAEDTNLYRALVDSTTRERQTGATAVSAWLGDRQGHPVHVSIEGIGSTRLDAELITWLRDRVVRELAELAERPADDPVLLELNQRLRHEWTARVRQVRKWVGSPPRFGARGVYTAWQEHLEGLEGEGGFRRNLAEGPALAWALEQLERTDNVWAELLERWHLLGVTPLVTVARPSAALLEEAAAEREARLAHDIEALMAREGTTDPQEALRALKSRFDAATEALEAAEGQASASFLAEPPLTADDRLDWEQTEVSGVPLVASRFRTMSGAEVGLALTLAGVDEAHEDLLAVLPDLLTEVGVVVDGQPMPHAAVLEALRRDVLSVHASTTSNAWTGRIELAVVGSGTDADEARAALVWAARFLGSPDWRPENLPRLRDVVDEHLESVRNRMQGREEHWARAVGDAWVHQQDRLQLRAWCFLTRMFDVQRCKWRLLDPDEAADNALAALAELATRPAITERLVALRDEPGATGTVASDLERLLQDIPDASLGLDWPRLCARARADLSAPPERVLAALEALRADVVRRAGARLWAAGGAALDELHPDLEALVGTLGGGPVATRPRQARPELRARLADRGADAEATHVGLLDPNRQTGIVMLSIPFVGMQDTDDDSLLDLLAAKAYGGGGPHGLFMRTWAAGLAYSNGATASPTSGTFHYYAERCPELPRTVGFVVDVVKGPRPEVDLGEYTMAQVFWSRAGGSYEGRAAAMAADLVDGRGPEVEEATRRRFDTLRKRPDLDAAIARRIQTVYGRLLPGLGAPVTAAEGLSSLVIGDARQLDAWEAWLSSVEGSRVQRLFGRDFWLV